MYRLVAILAALCISSAAIGSGAPTGTPSLFKRMDATHGLSKDTDISYSVELDRDAIGVAAAQGGMWIDLPNGKRLFAKTDHQEQVGKDNLTWFGKVSLPAGERSVVITEGPDAVFGSLVSDDGSLLELESTHGITRLVHRNPRNDRTSHPLDPSKLDYRIAPTVMPSAVDRVRTKRALAMAANAPARVDILLGYTPGLVTRYGSASAAITRLNYLVSVVNQAYQDSQVAGRMRLVGTLEVNYPDTNTTSQALHDLEDTSGASPLQSLRDARRATGADLVSLVRPFLSPQQGDCGLATVNGSNLSAYTTSAAGGGYSGVGDGSDQNNYYYCTITTLAHETGHNMGLVHDAANSSAPGPFPYTYGWRETLPAGSFYTLMAYGTDKQKLAPYYSNPNISYCSNTPCGDAATANQALALNQVMPVVAAFNGLFDPNVDLNDNGNADLLYQYDGGVVYILASAGYPTDGNGAQTMMTGYHVAAVGDLNGDHRADLIWTSAANDLYFWIAQTTRTATSAFVQTQGPAIAAGDSLVGTADINGDGNADLLFINKTANTFTYWLMNGTTRISSTTTSIPAGNTIASVGDFNGDGYIDVMWTNAAHTLTYWMNKGDGTFTVTPGPSYAANWTLVGSGDIDNDGKADLVFVDSTTSQIDYWLMNGATSTGSGTLALPAGYSVAAVDRYSGATASILLTSAKRDLVLLVNDGSGNFTSTPLSLIRPSSPGAGSYYSTYLAGWSVVSATPTQP